MYQINVVEQIYSFAGCLNFWHKGFHIFSCRLISVLLDFWSSADLWYWSCQVASSCILDLNVYEFSVWEGNIINLCWWFHCRVPLHAQHHRFVLNSPFSRTWLMMLWWFVTQSVSPHSVITSCVNIKDTYIQIKTVFLSSLSSGAGRVCILPQAPSFLTGAVLGRRRPSVPAAQHQEEADRLAQVEVTPAGQSAVPGRVRQIRDGHRREIHEILALRLHHLHHGDNRRRLSEREQDQSQRTHTHTATDNGTHTSAPRFHSKSTVIVLATEIRKN